MRLEVTAWQSKFLPLFTWVHECRGTLAPLGRCCAWWYKMLLPFIPSVALLNWDFCFLLQHSATVLQFWRNVVTVQPSLLNNDCSYKHLLSNIEESWYLGHCIVVLYTTLNWLYTLYPRWRTVQNIHSSQQLNIYWDCP